MAAVGSPITSGDWIVKEGKQEEFKKAWGEFVEWTLDTFPGVSGAFLIQQDDDPRHFISVGYWADKDTIGRWRGHPDFPQKLGAARELCDQFQGKDYTSVVDFTSS